MLAISLVALSGCVATEMSSAQLDQVYTNITKLEQSLSKQISQSCKPDSEELATQVAAKLSTNNVIKSTKLGKEVVYVERCSIKDKKSVSADDKLVIGEIEKILLIKEKLSFDVRIDSGAETSSLGIYNLAQFERDGKKWVKFTLFKNTDAKAYEYPIFDTVKIKQQSDVKAKARIEIKINIRVGGKEYLGQIFNLADRNHLKFQVLIGRNFLRDIAVVDVSGKYLLGGE